MFENPLPVIVVKPRSLKKVFEGGTVKANGLNVEIQLCHNILPSF
jgi:hypothetical protein